MLRPFKTAIASASLAVTLVAPAAAARIDLPSLGLFATDLVSFEDVGATGIDSDIFFDTADFALSGSAFDVFTAPSGSLNIATGSLFGFIDFTVSQAGPDDSGEIVDFLFAVDDADGDFADLIGGQLLVTVSGDLANFATTLMDDGFAAGPFDVTFATLDDEQFAPIPLPASALLLGGGLGLLVLRRKRKQAA